MVVKVLEFTADKVITCSISVTLPYAGPSKMLTYVGIQNNWRMWRNWAVEK